MKLTVRRSLLIWILVLSLQPVMLKAQPGFGAATSLNAGWSFALYSKDTTALIPPKDASWQQVTLPHDWSIKQPLNKNNASCMGYLPGGIGWYRKQLYIPRQDKKVYLYFEGVYNRSEVFVNGHSLGKRPNGYVSFLYDITPFVVFNKENEVLVRVDHSRAADSRWYTGSGIYRNVWLVYADPVHIKQWGVYAYPRLQDHTGILNVEVAVTNTAANAAGITVLNELIEPGGKIVARDSRPLTVPGAGENKINIQLTLKNPQRWSLSTPVQYRLKTILVQKGKQLDATLTKTGFRVFTFDANKGFALNGEWMKVKGVCLHHDAGVLGAAFYKDVWRRRLLQLKQIGCNAIRTSHSPQAPALYDLCDELGILVMNEAFDEWEFAKRKWIEGWNVGTPGFEGNNDFFEAWGERDLADMVQRDRNHMSVFAWSIGNEVDYPNDPYSHPILNGVAENGFTQKIFGGYKKDAPDANRLGFIAKKLAAVVRQYDRSRPVTAGLAGVAMSNETEYPAALDIAGYNYTESRYISDHKKYPNRVIFGSENRNDLDAWKAVVNNEHIFGQFLWTGIDYLGESGRWPSRGFYSGLLDFAGFIKPRGYYRQALWGAQPVAYLGTYPISGKAGGGPGQDVLNESSRGAEEKAPSMDAWPLWNYTPGQRIRVVCYTNAAKARLLLNGKVAGATKAPDTRTGIIFWDIPFEPGTLTVEGLNAAETMIASKQIHTSGKPYAVQLLEKIPVMDQSERVYQVAVQLVDKQGNPVKTDDKELTCTVSGPAELLGLEAGDNRDMGDYTDNKQKTFQGRLMAYIKRNGKAGPIRVSFSAQGIKSFVISYK
ncbi:MAG: DUF4982 domain-containing protein [Niabella sp.]|nr:DUF4982 domain-containing protein [Niabella sp.]